MRNNYRGTSVVITLLILLLFSLFQSRNELSNLPLASFFALPTPSPQVTIIPFVLPETSETATVTRVIDGDTIELEDGRKLRYIGIDTPETVDPRRGVQCFGKEAAAKNKELVLNKQVRLEKDISETDSFGRILRYVYVGDFMINEQLVREGFARASSFPPDIKYQEKLRAAEQLARQEKKGLWGSCFL